MEIAVSEWQKEKRKKTSEKSQWELWGMMKSKYSHYENSRRKVENMYLKQ